MFVPVSLVFNFPVGGTKEDIIDYLSSIHRELYWKSSDKIQKFRVWGLSYEERYAKDVDLWVHFATKLGNVEEFSLFPYGDESCPIYQFPQFGYKNSSMRNLFLFNCQLNPRASVHWSSLVSLQIGFIELTDCVMERVLSGCPNLECLELIQLSGIRLLEIRSVKLRELTLIDYYDKNHDIWLEIIAPYIQQLELLGSFSEIRIGQRNVASLVTAKLGLNFRFEDKVRNLEKECSYLKELLHSVAHVENLELGTWCIECMSVLELKGWQSPPSRQKLLEISAIIDQLEFPGICSFLRNSAELETLVIDWHWWCNNESRELLLKCTNEDEQSRRFETHYFNCSLLHLKTIKFIDCFDLLTKKNSVLPLVKYLLKHATVLEKIVVAARLIGTVASRDYVKMEQEFLGFPRSSPNASIMFSYL